VIPKVFHQIWVGPQPLPDEFKELQSGWRRLHPSWELKLWTDANLPANLVRPEVYELLRQPGERADILRLELLSRFGGVYVDVDFEALKPIDELLDGVPAFFGALDSGRISNAIIGSVPGHPYFARALDELRPRMTYGPVDRERTGPLLLDRLLKDFPDVKVFPYDLFYATSPEAAVYAYHLPARTWKDEELLRADLRRAEAARAYAQDELGRVQKRLDLALGELEALRAGHSARAAALRARRAAVRRIPGKVRRLLGLS
jgi:hypothetical protein